MKNFSLKPIGFIRSELKRRDEAPVQGFEGAPNAFVEVLPSYRKALHRMQGATKSLLSPGSIAPGGTYSKLTPEVTDLVHLQEYFRLDHQIVLIPWGFIA
jgi:hypothetical protein